MNMLLGALYSTWAATLYSCLLTALGSLFAYELARIFSPLVSYYLPTPLSLTKRTLPSPTSSQFTSSLLLARLFPLLPYSVLNLVSGVLHHPRQPFFWTIVVGSWPYNYVTTQCGEILALAGASEEGIGGIWNARMVGKLLFVSLVSTVPLVAKNQLQRAVTALLAHVSLLTGAGNGVGGRGDGIGMGSLGGGRRMSGRERRRKNRSDLSGIGGGRTYGHVPRKSAVIVGGFAGADGKGKGKGSGSGSGGRGRSGTGRLEEGWFEQGQ
ncbi:hypothetical protein BT69DRAFT_1286319 [Atractiella rhizophila]|nr:hypothetical protein BT69DRAFT_1286319 [Atractiella rhizophila]